MPQEHTPQEVWSLILDNCQNRLNQQTISTWLKPSRAHSLLDGALTVELKNKFTAFYVEQNYQDILNQVSSEALGKSFSINFIFKEDKNQQMELWELSLGPQAGTPVVPAGDTARPAASSGKFTRIDSLDQAPDNGSLKLYIGALNPRYTFENFVVGNNSQLAHAAALSVADSPGKRYNPLFIYGGVGLGKTHVMQAVGHALCDKFGDRGLKICYVSAETFLNELIAAIKSGTMTKFRNRYRRMDVLLIDDIEFISEKEGTQEEFFHTFNTLYESQKQIVLTSDRAPREIQHLEERLRSRFHWGLIADIQPPEYETRFAILKKKSETSRILVPEEVLEFIAGKVKSNVRLLEGSLHYLEHFSNTHKTDINLKLAERVLKNIFEQQINHISVENILVTVSKEFGVPRDALRSQKRNRVISEPRQVAMYICHRMTNLSTTEIAQKFERKDHTTVLHACKKVAGRLLNDIDFDSKIESIIEKLKNHKI
ncbi:MAG: chromosomal replication initiator protein DnaA [Candidatus Glassbacteria bacterium]|nr:chromosomal replication initiator protein DnaA [Candidatus Glassbacteria bacterium]